MCQMNISSLSCLPIMFLFPLTSTYWTPTKYANIFCTKIRLCLRNIVNILISFFINHYQWRFAFAYTEIFSRLKPTSDAHCVKSTRFRSFSGRIFPFSIEMPEKMDQKNSEYVHFSRSDRKYSVNFAYL